MSVISEWLEANPAPEMTAEKRAALNGLKQVILPDLRPVNELLRATMVADLKRVIEYATSQIAYVESGYPSHRGELDSDEVDEVWLYRHYRKLACYVPRDS